MKKIILDTGRRLATEPPTKEEVDRAKTRIVQGMDRDVGQFAAAGNGSDRSRSRMATGACCSPITKRSSASPPRMSLAWRRHISRIRIAPSACSFRRTRRPIARLCLQLPDGYASAFVHTGHQGRNRRGARSLACGHRETSLNARRLPSGLHLALLPKATRGNRVQASADAPLRRREVARRASMRWPR